MRKRAFLGIAAAVVLPGLITFSLGRPGGGGGDQGPNDACCFYGSPQVQPGGCSGSYPLTQKVVSTPGVACPETATFQYGTCSVTYTKTGSGPCSGGEPLEP
jgi:hypothetical protein